MQKKLIALAVASLVSAPVFAQSQVTLYGTFDAGVRNVNNANGAGDSQLGMDSAGTYNSNRWGVKGSEDLGNGMKANFNLEGGFTSGSGTIDKADGATGATNTGQATAAATSTPLFQRKAIVGLSGAWGAVDLGRNYTTIFYTTAAYDPFNYKYTGIIPITGLDGARRNNDIQYTGTFGGLTLRVEHALGQTVGSSSQGATDEIGANYANGPWNVGAAYAHVKSVSAAATAAGFTSSVATGALVISPVAAVAAVPSLATKMWTIGGGYNFNPFAIKAGYFDKKADNDANFLSGTAEQKTSWLGGSYAMSGANSLTLAYYHTKLNNYFNKNVGVGTGVNGANKLWVLGFVHNLSKRTEFYADIDNRKLDGNQLIGYDGKAATATKDRQTGISVGINHAF